MTTGRINQVACFARSSACVVPAHARPHCIANGACCSARLSWGKTKRVRARPGSPMCGAREARQIAFSATFQRIRPRRLEFKGGLARLSFSTQSSRAAACFQRSLAESLCSSASSMQGTPNRALFRNNARLGFPLRFGSLSRSGPSRL